MDTTARAIFTGAFFLFILLSGLRLSRRGRPLNVVLSMAHKLISLATGVFLLATIHQRHRMVPLGSTEGIADVVTDLCFLGVVASGGLLSLEKPAPVAVLRMHQLLPILTVLSIATTSYLVLGP